MKQIKSQNMNHTTSLLFSMCNLISIFNVTINPQGTRANRKWHISRNSKKNILISVEHCKTAKTENLQKPHNFETAKPHTKNPKKPTLNKNYEFHWCLSEVNTSARKIDF